MPNVKHPKENLLWPAWFYPPETDENDPTAAGRVFAKWEDVPEGWAFHWSEHGVGLDREPPPPPPLGMSRADLRAELTKRDINWSAQSSNAHLQRLLDEDIAAEALSNSV